MTPTCATCRYYSEPDGVCRRYPPTVVRYTRHVNGYPEVLTDNTWPAVSGFCWCGEHTTQASEVEA